MLIQPLRMADYVRREIHERDEKRFDDAITPPLLLMLSVLIGHLVEMQAHATSRWRSGSLSEALLANEQSLLAFRCIIYSLWPLLAAAWFLACVRQPLRRETLQTPFYEQCFLTSPFCLAVSSGTALAVGARPGWTMAGVTIVGLAAVWWVGAQARWIRHRTAGSWPMALGSASGVFLIGLALVVATALLLR